MAQATKRHKTAAQELATLDECNDALRQVGLLELDLECVKTWCDEQVLVAKKEATERAKKTIAKRDALVIQLELYYERHKQDLEAGGKKTVVLTYGKMGRRLSTSLKTASRQTWKKVLEKVQAAYADGRFVRTKEEVDKDAVRKANLTSPELSKLGLRLDSEHAWWYEIDRSKLEVGDV